MLLKRILVATDFNELATAALHSAAGIAARTGAELVVVYADRFEPPVEFTATQLPHLALDLDESRERAQKALEDYVSLHVSSAIPRRLFVREDLPVSAIVKAADEVDADVIVMGTHGRGGFARLLLGSVAEGVLYASERPVMTLRAGATARTIRRILCPIDVSAPPEDALAAASTIARELDADLILLNVAASETAAEEARAALAVIAPTPRESHETTMATMVLEGDPSPAVLEFAERNAIDLIVTGTRGKRTAFGSVTTRIVRRATCSVLVVRCDNC
jgi:nucleotide-binding universal stress UspA family protein